MNTLRNLEKYKILLASKSPRRRELLEMLRLPFNCISIGCIDESYPEEMPKESVPQYLSNKKADAYIEELKDNELIITADTLVIGEESVLSEDGNPTGETHTAIFGKPKDNEDAKRMIRELSGKVHKVVTGVTILTRSQRASFTAVTEVKFSTLSDDEIEYYVDTYHPLDKAGAYGIQEWIGCIAVEWINGSFYNVMGLPVHRLYQELKLF